jgi:hypothetical protein
MADVTISSLPTGAPSGNALLPFSNGASTLGVPVSAILQTAGNIGIGTVSPVHKLDVNGASSFRGDLNMLGTGAPAAGNYRLLEINSGNDAIRLRAGYGDTVFSGMGVSDIALGTLSNHDLKIYANNTLSTTFKANGNVGIGTATPAAKLDVAGDVKATNTPKAWVNFDGTGAIGTNQAIRSSYNVASVYKGNTGSYRITFTTAQTDNNYCVTGATAPAYAAYWTNLVIHTAAPTNGGNESAPTNAYFDVCVAMQTVGKVDSKYVSVVVL